MWQTERQVSTVMKETERLWPLYRYVAVNLPDVPVRVDEPVEDDVMSIETALADTPFRISGEFRGAICSAQAGGKNELNPLQIIK